MSGPRSCSNSKEKARSQLFSAMPLILVAGILPRTMQHWRLTVLLHASKELDDDLGRRADQHLSPSALLGVGDCFKAICEY